MTDLIKHIRGIHYFLLIACGTLFYIGSIAGTQYSILIAEANHLNYYVQKLTQEVQAGDANLSIINESAYKSYFNDIEDALNSRTNRGINIELPILEKIYRPLVSSQIENHQTQPIEKLKDKLDNYKTEVMLLDAPIPDQRISWPPTDSGKPNIKSAQARWIHADTAVVTFVTEVYVRSPEGSSIVETDFDVTFTTKRKVLKFSEEYFDKHYPVLLEVKNELWSYSIQDLIKVSRSRMGADIENKTPKSSPVNLLGIQIQGEHVGVFGSLIIIITALYLNIYLSELRRMTTVRPIDPKESILWIGMMDSELASLFCLLSIGLLPAVTVSLIFYRFVLSSIGVLLPGLLVLLLGLVTYNKLISIRKKSSEA